MRALTVRRSLVALLAVPALLAVGLWLMPPAGPRASFTAPGVCVAVAFSPDGRTLAMVTRHRGTPDPSYRVCLRETDTGRHLADLLRAEGPVRSVAFSPDGRSVAALDDRGTVGVWDVPAGTPRASFRAKGLPEPSARTHVAFTPGGRLVVAGDQQPDYKQWDPATGRELRTLVARGEWDSSSLGTPGFVVYNRRPGRTLKVVDLATGELRAAWRGYEGPAAGVAVTPDGAFCAVARGGGVRVWDERAGTEKRIGRGEAVSRPSLSPDGRAVAVTVQHSQEGWHPWLDRALAWFGVDVVGPPHSVVVYEVATGRRLARFRGASRARFAPGEGLLLLDYGQGVFRVADLRRPPSAGWVLGAPALVALLPGAAFLAVRLARRARRARATHESLPG